jgi:alkylhydroperoxidase family enzyme
MHADAARAAGVEQAKLDSPAGWREDAAFTSRERAALGLAEAIAGMGPDGLGEQGYAGIRDVRP